MPFTLQAYGEQTTSASLAGVLLASIPLFTLAIATAALPAERVSVRRAAGLAVGFLGVVIVGVVAAAGRSAPELTGRVVASVLFLGVVGTGAAYVLYFRLVGDVGATSAAAVSYVVPLVAVAVGVALLGESVTASMVAGGAVVLAGMAVAEGRFGLRRGVTPVRCPTGRGRSGSRGGAGPSRR